MTISRSRRTTTVAALAATALGGGALAASAVSATGTAHTSLSIRAQHSHVAAGHTDHIAGNLRAAGKPAAGETVTLEARPTGSGHFSPAGTSTTGPHGRVVFTVAPTATTRYALRFAGDAADHPSHSGVVTVRVAAGHHHRRLGSALAIRVGRHSIPFGATDHIVGRLTHRHFGLRGRHVILQSRTPKTMPWTVVADHVTGPRGWVRYAVAPTSSTRYRLVFAGGELLRPSRSAGRTIVVRASRLSAAVSPRTIDAGQSAAVSGVLTTDGAPDQGATIDLRSKVVGSHAGFSTAGTATTAADGSVSFPVMPTVSTRYRLVEPASSSSAAVASRVVTVTLRKGSSLSIRGKQVATGENISGVLRGGGHALRDRRVTLQSRPSGSTTWSPVRTRRTGRHGLVRFHVATPSVSTDYQLVFSGGARYAGSASGIVMVTES